MLFLCIQTSMKQVIFIQLCFNINKYTCCFEHTHYNISVFQTEPTREQSSRSSSRWETLRTILGYTPPTFKIWIHRTLLSTTHHIMHIHYKLYVMHHKYRTDGLIPHTFIVDHLPIMKTNVWLMVVNLSPTNYLHYLKGKLNFGHFLTQRNVLFPLSSSPFFRCLIFQVTGSATSTVLSILTVMPCVTPASDRHSRGCCHATWEAQGGVH